MTLQRMPGEGIDGDGGRLPDLDGRQLRLTVIRDDPDTGRAAPGAGL